ncbi:MAG: glycosyltransferase [Ferruginibacter sp.]
MRLLICTLYFPPCTLTPANRAYSWAKYLQLFGIYPVIITRQWPTVFNPDLYEERAIGAEVVIEKYPQYEVHYLPFLGNYRTRSLEKHGSTKNKMPRRFFLVTELLFRNVFHTLLPYKNLFTYALEYVRDNKVDKVLVSASPFQLFKIGYLIKKRYNIPWVADYRDGWTSGNHDYPSGFIGKLERISNKYFERKWLHTADCFITVSPYLKNSIEKTIGKKGYEIYNGFFREDSLRRLPEQDKTQISFLYSGTMYSTQDYRTVVQVFKKLIETYKHKITIKILFLGTVYKDDKFKNDPVFSGFEKHFILMDRVSYADALKIHETADVFLMLTYQGVKGIPSSKIFDYIKFNKPVLLFPNDHDILEEILTGTGLGIIADNDGILEEKLEKLIKEKIDKGYIDSLPDTEYINLFNRENQAKYLADLIKS